MNNISFHIENVSVPDYDPEFLRLWINHVVCDLGNVVGDIAYVFCSDDYILDINKQYLNHDYFTDIITFNYNEGSMISGDIFISIDTVGSNALDFSGGDFDKELNRVIIHGVLHLCGFNDKTEEEKKIMTNKENWALNERSRFT